MLSIKNFLYILILCVLVIAACYYLSDKKTSERDYFSMIHQGNIKLETIHNYLTHHNHSTDWEYDQALRLAIKQDIKYLPEILEHYNNGSLRLDTATANIIIQQLPSDSKVINYAAGRIFSSNEYGHFDVIKATAHLEYASLRGDKNAAEILFQLYSEKECYVEAITWAKVANSRDISSECTQLPVDVNLLTEQQWDDVLYNEEELEQARKNNRIAKLKYSKQCELSIK